MANKYYIYTLRQPARALFSNLTVASRPKTVAEAKTKYSVTLGIEDDEDAKALFQLEAQALTEAFGSFSKPEDYQLAVISGAKAAERELLKADLASRGKSADEVFKIKEKAEKRAEQYRAYKAILNASSRTSAFDRFLDRYMNDLDAKERENADRFGFKLGVLSTKGVTTLDTQLLFNEYKDKFYSGAYLGGTFNLNAWPRKKAEDKDGVTCYLKNMVFVKDGERLTHERSLDDEFSHYQGHATEYSPTQAAGQKQAAVNAHDF